MTTSRRHLTFLSTAILAAACSKGTTAPASTGSGASGIAAPSEISALPTKSSAAHAVASSHYLSSLGYALATDPGTDYATAPSFKFVNEQALSQFDTFNTIFKALGETHYADAENVNKGPYGCMVTWAEDHGGNSNGKQLIPWVVDSKMTVDAAGKDVNQVKVWMQQTMGDGQMHVIKVELDIYEAPTQRADGSYADYGIWTINAKFDEKATGFFAASSDHDANGLSIVKLHEMDPKGGGGGGGGGAPPQGQETRGILQRSDAQGYGQVRFPDFSDCHAPDCQPAPVTVSYAYNANHVVLKKGQNGTPVFKDRTSVVDLVNRYGLYDAVTGADVTKTHSFGFPINFSDANGQHWGYYGAWQGRHQLGYDGMQQIPEGATVTRADRPPNTAPETYTVSAAFKGTLVKRTLVPGDIQGIKDIVVQTYVNKNFQLGYKNGHWLNCGTSWLNLQGGPNGPGAPTCGDGSTPAVFTDFASLALNPNDPQRQVMINYMPANQQCTPGTPCGQMLVYADGALYHTNWTQPLPGSQMTQPTSNGDLLAPNQGDHLSVMVGGPIYISYNGSTFVRKSVLSFDQNTFTATFDPNGDTAYDLEQGREYYINTPGVNFIVKRTDATTYVVKTELQSAANPVNASTFVVAGTTFRQQWDQSACSASCSENAPQSTYKFVTDPASPNYLKLVYDCKGASETGVAAGDVVTNGQWGLVAYDSSCNNTGVQFNWDYPQGDQNWGSQQFLVKNGAYVILEDPIRLASIQLPNHAGKEQTLSLQFDGNWVNGLPDVYQDLQKNSFVMTPAIADKVVVIPAGTEVVDASDASKHYLFKPLQTNEFLAIIDDPGDVDLSPASDLDLSTVPDYVEHNLGALPDVPVKYSEGKLLQ